MIKSMVLIVLGQNTCGAHVESWGLGFCATQLSTQVSSLTSKKCYHAGVHHVILGIWDPV